MKTRQIKFAPLFVLMIMLFCGDAFSATTATNELGVVTHRVMTDELDLMLMSARFKVQAAPRSQWRERRWFAYSVANQSLTVVGALMNGAGRLYYQHSTRTAPKYLFINASWLRIIANAIAIGGCINEAGVDGARQFGQRKKDGDVSSNMIRAHRLFAEIDVDISRRRSLTQALQPDEIKDDLDKETNLLEDVRDGCAYDLEESSTRLKAVRAQRYFQYAFVGSSNLIGAAGTISNNVESIRNHSSRANWPGGAGDIISGSMNTIAPEVIKYSGTLSTRASGHELTASISASSPKDYIIKEMQTELQSVHRKNASKLQNDTRVYDAEVEYLRESLLAPVKPAKGTVGRVVGNFGSAAGGIGKVVNGIEVLVGSYHYPTAGQKRFQNFGAGGIVYGAGVAVAEEETIRREFISELKWHRQPFNKRSVEIAKANLKRLTQAQAVLAQK